MATDQESRGRSLWDEPVFRLLMFGVLTVVALDNALDHHGPWRIVWGIGCAFILVGFLIEVRDLIRRRRSGPSPIQ